jgi:hypothetical protein
MNLFAVLTVILLLLILDRLSHLVHAAGSVSVSKEAFLESVRRLDAPVVLGAPRHHYACTYKNHRLYARSFSPLSLPSSADVIQVRKW